MTWLGRFSARVASTMKTHSSSLNESPRVATLQAVKQTLLEQQANRKRDSLIQELAQVHRTQQNPTSTSSKIGFGAAMMVGATILLTPMKEATPARVIMTGVEHHLQRRRGQTGFLVSMVWMKEKYRWIVTHLLAMIVAIATYWKVTMSS
ncbi:unnamed protein product [Aureobasidium uvarum]|uniref:Uncharacterized protein n=1 Tax=Aureobasidium uvarum TaxID=2773716 RepID=A0A9N8PRX7_9PEZI|nr:unnamed protein product [Aureobasidium uvarum]